MPMRTIFVTYFLPGNIYLTKMGEVIYIEDCGISDCKCLFKGKRIRIPKEDLQAA